MLLADALGFPTEVLSFCRRCGKAGGARPIRTAYDEYEAAQEGRCSDSLSNSDSSRCVENVRTGEAPASPTSLNSSVGSGRNTR